MSNALKADRRWRRLREGTWITCPSCGAAHSGIFDLACDKPIHWPGPAEYSPNSIRSTSSHFLSQDFCALEGEDFFVRCVLELPIQGAQDESFSFGVWSSLSQKNFALYAEQFDRDDNETLGPWFGWFSNRLDGYPNTLNLKCQVHPRSGRCRPLIKLEPMDHPLACEQRDGITLDRLLEIYAAHGHDIGAALLDA